MLLFWTLALLMILAAVLLVVPPMIRGGVYGRDDIADTNVALYRERLAELDRQRERGEIEGERYAALREDLERGLLADVAHRESSGTIAHPPPYPVAMAMAVAVPVCGLALYLWLGTPQGLDLRPQPRETAAGADQLPEVQAMVVSLAARLAADPADADGWLLLARSQVVLERFGAATVSFGRAHALLGDDPSLLADWAEADAGSAGNRFPVSALVRLERALELDPDHEKALWLGGFAAAQSGRADIAVARWERLHARQAPGSREESILAELLAQVRGAGGATPVDRSDPSESTGPGEAAGAVSDDVPAAGARIVVDVGLAPDLAVELGASEPVFVFARIPGGSGPPLAVARTVVGALPATIVLDETNAMVPSLSLASAEHVLITARVARSGTVTRTSGDVEGVSGPVAVNDSEPVRIVLSQTVP